MKSESVHLSHNKFPLWYVSVYRSAHMENFNTVEFKEIELKQRKNKHIQEKHVYAGPHYFIF